jgi:hypothetical protein
MRGERNEINKKKNKTIRIGRLKEKINICFSDLRQ